MTARDPVSLSMSAALSVHREEAIEKNNPTATIHESAKAASSRQTELVPTSTPSAKTTLVTYLSSKFNSVVPVMNNMDESELKDYGQLAALSSGGMMDESAVEDFLQNRLGLKVEDDGKEDEELGN